MRSTAGSLEAARHWLILGSGGYSRSVADAIRAQGDAVPGFLGHSRPADELVAGIPVLAPLRLTWDGALTPDRFVVAIGNPVLYQCVAHAGFAVALIALLSSSSMAPTSCGFDV